jgi:putative transposase
MLKLLLRTFLSGLRSRRELVLENLALRHQLEVLQRTTGRPRLKPTDRALWVLISRVFGRWRRCLTFVKPDTVIRWHRLGWRLFWRRRSRAKRRGRPLVDHEVRAMIRRLSLENPLWGAPRIHGELLKLGYEVAEATVGKYMVKSIGPAGQSWRTFLRNHLHEIAAIDFFTVPTVTFKTLYIFLVLSLDRRRVVHFDVTDSPTAAWISLQLMQAFPFEIAPRYLIRDSDGIYGEQISKTLAMLGTKEKVIAYRSPWQNGYCERLGGSLRRECLDHVIVLNERHLRRVLKEYVAYYHRSRTHLGLDKDTPELRPIQGRDEGDVVSESVLGGLHHRYWRQAA